MRGLGPKSREALAKVGTTTVADLVWTLPAGWDDARSPLSVGSAVSRARSEPLGVRVCLHGLVKSAGLVPLREEARGARRDRPCRGRSCGRGFDHAVVVLRRAWRSRGRNAGERGHRDRPRAREPREAAAHRAPGHREGRRTSARRSPALPAPGVPEGTLRKAIAHALGGIESPPDFVPSAIASRERLPAVGALLSALHGRDGVAPAVARLGTRRAALERLAWAEAFTRAWQRVGVDAGAGGGEAGPRAPGRSRRSRPASRGARLQADARSKRRPSRRSARTSPTRRRCVACSSGTWGPERPPWRLAAAAQCVSAGAQVAILAPTSVLAEQYMDAVGPLARATGASVALVAAGVPAAQRRRREEGLARGTLSIAVGTHALLRDQIVVQEAGARDRRRAASPWRRPAAGARAQRERRRAPSGHTCSRSARRRSRARSPSRCAASSRRVSSASARRGRPPVVTEIRPAGLASRRSWRRSAPRAREASARSSSRRASTKPKRTRGPPRTTLGARSSSRRSPRRQSALQGRPRPRRPFQRRETPCDARVSRRRAPPFSWEPRSSRSGSTSRKRP